MNIDRAIKGIRNPFLAGNYVRTKVGYRILQRLNSPNNGIYVLDQDWDNLIILDSCRYDIFERVNTLPGTPTRVRSRASQTGEFIEENFGGRSAYDTIYASSVAAVGRCQEFLDLYKVVGLWDYDDKSTYYGRHPKLLVDKVTELHDEYPDKRLIAHFFPPHAPFFVKDGETLPPRERNYYHRAAKYGEIPNDDLRAVYEENVEFALEYVVELIGELDGKTVVTADHGELLGDSVPLHYKLLHGRWSLTDIDYHRYGHTRHFYRPELVEVPWLEIEADERRTIRAAESPERYEMNNANIEEQLEALGYRPGDFNDNE